MIPGLFAKMVSSRPPIRALKSDIQVCCQPPEVELPTKLTKCMCWISSQALCHLQGMQFLRVQRLRGVIVRAIWSVLFTYKLLIPSGDTWG